MGQPDGLVRAIKTPQILELSGIGDRKILEPLGIKPVLHLPTVGTNAQEHFFVSAPIFRACFHLSLPFESLTSNAGMRDDKGIITTNMLLDPAFLSSTVKRLFVPFFSVSTVCSCLSQESRS